MAGDVKVRFSAEGDEGVVEAFTKIREEAKKTSEEGSKSFETLKDAAGELGKELLGFLAIGAAVDKTKELFAEVLNGAVALDKLHQTTGMSTDALQSMGAAAKETMVDQQALNKGLELFARTMGQAEEGSKKATTALAAIGIQLKDLKGLNSDQQFQLVAQHLAEIEDPAKRAAEGAALFGRQFAEIEPAILAVADEGFGHFTQKLKEIGVYLDGDAIAQMKAAKQGLNEIGEETKGLATQFLVGLMPAVNEAMDSFIKATSGPEGGVGAMQKLGQVVGAIVVTIENMFQEAGEMIGAFSAKAVNDFQAIGNAFDAVKNRDWKGVKSAFSDAGAANDAINEMRDEQTRQHDEAIRKSWAVVFGTEQPDKLPAKPGNQAKGAFETDENASANVNKARLALIQAQLEAELKLYQAQSKLKLDQEKQDYESGKISLEQYYNDRAQIIQAQGDKELEILKARRAAVASSPIAKNDDGTGALQKQAELARLDADIGAKQIEIQQQLTQLKTEERQAQQKNYEEQLSAEEKLLTIEGKKTDAARLQLDLETQKLAKELSKSGASAGEIAGAVGDFKSQGEAKIDFDQTKQDANATLTSLQTQIKAIQDQVKSGVLFPVQAEEQIIALEKQRLPVLEQLAQQMVDLANKTKTPGNPLGDEQMIAQAEQFKQKIDEISLATDQSAQQMAKLKQTAQDALQNGLSNFLYNVATGTESVGQAFQQMALQFVEAIAKMEAQYLASQAIKWLNGMGNNDSDSSGSGGGGGGLFGAIAGLFSGGGGGGYASGGHVRGAGTSTSDSIPAMLSDGEFVVNAGAASRPGMLALLHAINGTPGYAAGGMGGVAKFASGGQVSAPSPQINHYNVDASTMPKEALRAAFQDFVFESVSKNPQKYRNSLS